MLLPLGLINSVSHVGRRAWFISTLRGRESVAVGCACSRHPPLSPESANAERINGAAMREHQKSRPAAVLKNRYLVPVLIDENSRFANAK